jgi:hypothetical protein
MVTPTERLLPTHHTVTLDCHTHAHAHTHTLTQNTPGGQAEVRQGNSAPFWWAGAPYESFKLAFEKLEQIGGAKPQVSWDLGVCCVWQAHPSRSASAITMGHTDPGSSLCTHTPCRALSSSWRTTTTS